MCWNLKPLGEQVVGNRIQLSEQFFSKKVIIPRRDCGHEQTFLFFHLAAMLWQGYRRSIDMGATEHGRARAVQCARTLG